MNTKWEDVQKAEIGHIFIDRQDGMMWFVVLRGPYSLCAYIGIPANHPLAGHHYEALPVRCHGGLTYAGNTIPALTRLDAKLFWYGWDYAHSGDYLTYYDEPGFSGSPACLAGEHKWLPEEVDEDSWQARYDMQRLARLTERCCVSPSALLTA
jgi:hypothetical protein